MELVELIRGAQDAMDHGDYRLAVAECSHILESYPACLTAHRMLGEAHLEQGQIDAAHEHFERTLAIDPLNVVARLGLGVAAEEQKEMGRAYAEYLHAWEINPALDQVRDELVRLRGLLAGDERLHPTRAGLAGIFARSGQFGRAAAEWRAVLLAEPESRRARTALAEVLWRSGDDTAAAAVAREILAAVPENARALAIVADIDQRRNAPGVTDLVACYQDIDPTGEVVTLFSEWREDLDLSFLRRMSAPLPEFDFVAVPAGVPQYAEATASVGAGTSSLAAGHFAAPDLWDTLVRDFQPGMGEPGAEDDVLPFSWLDEGEAPAAPAAESFSLDALMEPHSAANGTADLEMPFADAPVATASDEPSLEAQLAAMSAPEPLASVAAPVPVEQAPVSPAEPPKPAPSSFVTADGRIDLTVGWDDLDRQLREATPSFDNASEIDSLMAQLGVDGVVPFDMGESPLDADAWAPFTDDELGVGAAPVAVSVSEAAPAPQRAAAPALEVDPAVEQALDLEGIPPFDASLFGEPGEASEPDEALWDLDDELRSAIPAPQSSGYTELLRHVDMELPQEVDFVDQSDPFTGPDSSGAPLAFEDLLAVTSKDGTAPLSPGGFDDAYTDDGSVNGLAPFDGAEWEPNSVDADPFAFEPAAVASAEFDSPANGEGAPLSFDDFVPASFGESAEGLDGLLDDLNGLQPFSLGDAFAVDAEVRATSDAVDFSDINEAPFDPASLAHVIAPAAAAPALGWSEPAPAQSAPEADALPVAAVETAAAPATAKSGTGGLGLTPSRVAWPTFINQTSELMDRGYNDGNLFARLRDAKRTAVAAGLLTVDRSLAAESTAPVAVPTPVPTEHEPHAPAEKRPPRVTKMTEAERIDLMAMRIRLIEEDDASAAGEVAKSLEAAVARGLSDPLALRVLGEAYLKQGRTEQAAAQFRQAMFARQRAR